MKSKNQEKDSGLLYFKSASLWLLAYKLFRDYFELIKFGQSPEPEKFFEVWIAKTHFHHAEYCEQDINKIWSIFLRLLIARAE